MIRKVSVPEGQSGEWRIERFEVSQRDAEFHALRCAASPGMARREVPAGLYTRLMRGDTVVMSDTPAEMLDHRRFVQMAQGAVLINGLGLGMVLQAVLDKPEVTSVIVVEVSQDVLNLVAPHYTDLRITYVRDDAFSYKPPRGMRFGAVWHDIWDNIIPDNLPEMKRLHRRYGRRADWQGSWCRDLCETRAKYF